LQPDLVHKIMAAFRAHEVRVAVLGCYINPLHSDPAVRKQSLALFKEYLQWARGFDCGLVALESCAPSGASASERSSKRLFAECAACLRDLTTEAERLGVSVGLEAVATHVISSPGRMRRMLDAVASPRLRVVFDPVNLLTAANCHRQSALVRESLDLFGPQIEVVHVKDFVADPANGSGLRTIPPGKGLMRYGPLLDFVRDSGRSIPVLLEETEPHDVDAALRFLRNN
jgi:sugar phosphate isomerase/epimerase